MKKNFLALSILAFPVTAHAQTPPKRVPEATVQAAIKEFVEPPSQCSKHKYLELVEKVQHCFLFTNKENPDMDKCILGHMTLNAVTKAFQQIALDRGVEDPTQHISFVNRNVSLMRLSNALMSHRYAMMGVEPLDYFENGASKVYDALNKSWNDCVKTNP